MSRYISIFTVCLLLVFGVSRQCSNGTPYGSTSEPATVGSSNVISSCIYVGEYGIVTSAVANTNYTITSSVTTDFITVRQETPAGPVIAFGTQPLLWTASDSVTYYIHVKTVL